jgi:hypothetical protein
VGLADDVLDPVRAEAVGEGAGRLRSSDGGGAVAGAGVEEVGHADKISAGEGRGKGVRAPVLTVSKSLNALI